MPSCTIQDVWPLMSAAEKRVHEFLKLSATSGHQEAAAAYGEHTLEMIERYELELRAAEACGATAEEIAS